MNFGDWHNLSDDDQAERCQRLNPYEDWDLFKQVESAFIAEYGGQLGVERIFCGMASGLGPCNSITVLIKRGQPKVNLPEYFLGFPVIRSYDRK